MKEKELFNISEIAGFKPLGDLENAAELTANAANRVDRDQAKAQKHLIDFHLKNNLEDKPIYKAIFEDGREMPTGDDVEFIINKLIKSHKLSKGDIARLLGVSPKGNTTLNRWLTGEDKSAIPYATWRLLCAYAGFALDLQLPEDFKQKA